MFSSGAQGGLFDKGLIALAVAFNMIVPPLLYLMYLPFARAENPLHSAHVLYVPMLVLYMGGSPIQTSLHQE